MCRRFLMGAALFHFDENHLVPISGNDVDLTAAAAPAARTDRHSATHVKMRHLILSRQPGQMRPFPPDRPPKRNSP